MRHGSSLPRTRVSLPRTPSWTCVPTPLLKLRGADATYVLTATGNVEATRRSGEHDLPWNRGRGTFRHVRAEGLPPRRKLLSGVSPPAHPLERPHVQGHGNRQAHRRHHAGLHENGGSLIPATVTACYMIALALGRLRGYLSNIDGWKLIDGLLELPDTMQRTLGLNGQI